MIQKKGERLRGNMAPFIVTSKHNKILLQTEPHNRHIFHIEEIRRSDGEPLYSTAHPSIIKTPWYKSLWQFIFGISFNKENIESIDTGYCDMDGKKIKR